MISSGLGLWAGPAQLRFEWHPSVHKLFRENFTDRGVKYGTIQKLQQPPLSVRFLQRKSYRYYIPCKNSLTPQLFLHVLTRVSHIWVVPGFLGNALSLIQVRWIPPLLTQTWEWKGIMNLSVYTEWIIS